MKFEVHFPALTWIILARHVHIIYSLYISTSRQQHQYANKGKNGVANPNKHILDCLCNPFLVLYFGDDLWGWAYYILRHCNSRANSQPTIMYQSYYLYPRIFPYFDICWWLESLLLNANNHQPRMGFEMFWPHFRHVESSIIHRARVFHRPGRVSRRSQCHRPGQRVGRNAKWSSRKAWDHGGLVTLWQINIDPARVWRIGFH